MTGRKDRIAEMAATFSELPQTARLNLIDAHVDGVRFVCNGEFWVRGDRG